MVAVGAQALHDREPVAVGEHHVEHDEVGPERLRRAQRLGAVAGDLDVEAFVPEGGCDEIGDVCLVVDDEDSGVSHMRMVASAAVRDPVVEPERSGSATLTRICNWSQDFARLMTDRRHGWRTMTAESTRGEQDMIGRRMVAAGVVVAAVAAGGVAGAIARRCPGSSGASSRLVVDDLQSSMLDARGRPAPTSAACAAGSAR